MKSGSERKIFFYKKTQLVELYKNASGVNYLACIYRDDIFVVTTFIFIFYYCFNLQHKINQSVKNKKRIREKVILVSISIKR